MERSDLKSGKNAPKTAKKWRKTAKNRAKEEIKTKNSPDTF